MRYVIVVFAVIYRCTLVESRPTISHNMSSVYDNNASSEHDVI